MEFLRNLGIKDRGERSTRRGMTRRVSILASLALVLLLGTPVSAETPVREVGQAAYPREYMYGSLLMRCVTGSEYGPSPDECIPTQARLIAAGVSPTPEALVMLSVRGWVSEDGSYGRLSVTGGAINLHPYRSYALIARRLNSAGEIDPNSAQHGFGTITADQLGAKAFTDVDVPLATLRNFPIADMAFVEQPASTGPMFQEPEGCRLVVEPCAVGSAPELNP